MGRITQYSYKLIRIISCTRALIDFHSHSPPKRRIVKIRLQIKKGERK
jgi:hypothetical protein